MPLNDDEGDSASRRAGNGAGGPRLRSVLMTGSDDFKRWAERGRVDDLSLADCVDFLRYWSGKLAHLLDGEGVAAGGTLDASEATADRPFEIRMARASWALNVAVDPEQFLKARFWSRDGIDYFELDMLFGERRVVSVRDLNMHDAPRFGDPW